MTVLSADWLVPVEGAPIRDGAVEIDDATGTIAAVGPREELGDSVHYDEAVILPERSSRNQEAAVRFGGDVVVAIARHAQ